ncbi:MAG: class I poly(R)-hydroxyalkanoic acid synthase [Burkholderiales bacterium]|nr:class I poly(R)-hydroxyalkanoic acid synthase [Burkholderiales bacterium]
MQAAAGAGLPPAVPDSGSARLCRLQADLHRAHASLWRSMLEGREPAPGEAGPADRRFGAPEWRASPYFRYLSECYRINSRFLVDSVEALDLDAAARERLRFFTRQWIDALSPANFAATNPEALKLALETQGESLSKGVLNLVQDLRKGRISTTDESAFEVGRDIAATPGAVVYENELMQLIQYAPVAAQVQRRPLVMVPPCINKYYVLDLRPENSLVRHALARGQRVFMISWRNIDASCAGFVWDDYLRLGVLAAIGAAADIAKSAQVNMLGFCVGGTLLGSALAVMAAKGDERVASATFLASMLDFGDVGEIAHFIDEPSHAAREAAIGAGGVMPGRDLAFVFSALRANDLVWPYVVGNYLKGGTPAAFDLLYWNSDGTNLPGPMYCYYVRHMYMENALRQPGRLTMLDVAVDLSRVRVPAYVLATREDHIVPWKTGYESARLLGGETCFVLGASGHIAGIVNPAASNRRSHWVNAGPGAALPADPGQWLAGASQARGSWWSHWTDWLAGHGGGLVKAGKRLGNARYRPAEPAPGRYVKQTAA